MSNPYPESAPSASKPNGPGLAALIVGLVLVTLTTTVQVLYVALPSIAASEGGSISDVLQSLIPVNIVIMLFAIAAFALGLIGVILPQRPRGAAAAGLALGGASLVGQLAPMLASMSLGG